MHAESSLLFCTAFIHLYAVSYCIMAAGETGGEAGVTVEGPLAALMRRAVYLYRQPTGEQRINVATQWLAQGAQIANSTLSYLQSRSGPGKA